MSKSTQLSSGQSASLPAGYLRARLTGSTSGVQLRVLDGDGSEVGETRDVDDEVDVRPRAGRLRLVAVPLAGNVFGVGCRIGADIKTLAVAGDSSPQILISDADASALAQHEIALLDFAEERGWTVAVGADFSFLMEPSGHLIEPALDEKGLPWLADGRYFLRRAFNGVAPPRGAVRPWALILDSSASMRATFDHESSAIVLQRLSGILAEWSGRLAEVTGLSGGLSPQWDDSGRKDPRSLLLSESDNIGPASWCLVEPAVRHAVGQGARTIVVVTDGPPADLELVTDLMGSAPGVEVAFVLAQRGEAGAGGVDGETRRLAVGAFGQAIDGRRVRGGVIDVSAHADDQQWVDLARLLVGAV